MYRNLLFLRSLLYSDTLRWFDESVSYERARQRCEEEGLELAKADTVSMNTWMGNYVRNNHWDLTGRTLTRCFLTDTTSTSRFYIKIIRYAVKSKEIVKEKKIEVTV